VDDKWSSLDAENPARVELPALKAGRRYRSRVEVRRTGVRALLDDKPVCEFAELGRLGPRSKPWPRDPRQLGVSVWGGPVEFHSAVVQDVSGSGTVTRAVAKLAVIDALALVNADRPVDDRGGSGERRPTGWLVVGHKAEGQAVHTALNMAPRAPAEYDLTVELTTVEPGRLVFRVPLPTGTACQAFVGADRNGYGRRYAYERVDGHAGTAADNPSARDGPERPVGKRMTVQVEVRRTGLRTLVDGAVAAEWGDLSQVTWPPGGGKLEPGVVGVSCFGGAVEFHRIEIAPPPATVDVLALADPAKDGRSGTWQRRGADLVGDGDWSGEQGGFTILNLPYHPPAEYDFAVEFTLTKTHPCLRLGLVLPDGRAVQWMMNYGADRRHGFQSVDDKPVTDPGNPTVVHRPELAVGRRHTTRVEVRRDGLRAFIDGAAVSEFRGDFARLGVAANLPRKARVLSLAIWGGPIEFHKAEVRDVTGKGTVTRPSAPP
jgi:hypothetical protein